ncbi:MAG: hypothetical protein IT208_07645 [Chthonomonadales bacterium]|nr:hypothetical protein [Chthonomonadales bacterium]
MSGTLQARLSAARRRWRAIEAGGGLAAAVGLLCLLALASFHVDRLLALSTLGRLAWLVALIAGAVAGLALLGARPLLRRRPDAEVALAVERRNPAIGERLLSSVELTGAGAGVVSSALVGALVQETEAVTASIDFARSVPRGPARRGGTLGMIGVGLLAAHFLLLPSAMRTWLARILLPAADIPLHGRTLVWVGPGDVVVPRGSDLDLTVTARGPRAPAAVVHYRFGSGPWLRETAAREGAERAAPTGDTPAEQSFVTRLRDLQRSVTYYARVGDGRSNAHAVRVEDRPAVLGVHLRLAYPPYTGKAPEEIAATGADVAAPIGTSVGVTATCSKPLASAAAERKGGKRDPWRVDGTTASGRFVVRGDEAYRLHLRDRNGFAARPPAEYTVKAITDRAPSVAITRPGADVERATGGSVDLLVSATDDYGVASIALAWRMPGRASTLPLVSAPGAASRSRVAASRLNLAPLRLKPGDTLIYQALATDADTVSGPHTGRSASYRVRIVGAGEMRDRLDLQAASETDALRRLVREQARAQVLAARARRGDAEAGRQASSIQAGLARQATELARGMERTTGEMRQNNVARASELARRESTANALARLARGAMPEAAGAVRSAARQSASEPAWRGAEQLQSAVREELERLLEATAPAPGAADLAREAERLAQQQRRLAERAAIAAERADPAVTAAARAEARRLAREQAAAAAQTRALERRVARAAAEASMERRPDAAALRDALQIATGASAAPPQDAAARRLQQADAAGALPEQAQAARSLEALERALSGEGRAPTDPGAMQKSSQDLGALADSLQDMAREQAEVARQAGRNPDEAAAAKLARQEERLDRRAAEAADKLNRSPAAADLARRAASRMREAGAHLRESNARQATTPAREATRNLLQASMEAREAARQLEQAAQAEKARRAVEQLARDQRAIRQRTAGADAARARATSQQAEKAARDLAAEQSAALQRGQSLGEGMPSNAFRLALGEATRRMDEARRRLDERKTDADTRRRQEHAAQVLDRLASALARRAQEAGDRARGGSDAGGMSADATDAAADLQLARELEGHIRQETAGIDRRRDGAPERALTPEQQRDVAYLAQAQRATEQIARRAAQAMGSSREIGDLTSRAVEEMQGIRDQLQNQQTGRPTQQRQDRAVALLDQAVNAAREAMQQQRAASSSAGRQAGGPPRPGGRMPLQRTTAPVVEAQLGVMRAVAARGRGLRGLSERAQRALREGRGEPVPAEYRDLVNQYYRALSESRR